MIHLITASLSTSQHVSKIVKAEVNYITKTQV